MPLPPNLLGAILALGAFGAYAWSDIVIKFLGQDYSSLQVLFTASLCSLPFILTRALTAPGGRDLRPRLLGFMALRIALIVVNSVIVTYTFTKLPIAQCYAIFFCMPLLVTLFAAPLLGENLDLPRILAMVTGFAGVLIALRPGSEPLQFAHLTAVLGASLGAMNSLLMRVVGDRERPTVILLYPAIAQVIATGAVMPWVWHPMPATHWGLAALIGAFSTLGGLLIIAAYTRSRAIVVAPMQYSQIIWAALAGLWIFGEPMDIWMILGIGVIISAGLFLLWRARAG